MDKIQRGVSAQVLLENDIFKEVMNTLDEQYTASWRASKTVEAREDCYRYTVLIEKLIADIQTIATTGRLEQARIKELEGQKKGILKWPMAI